MFGENAWMYMVSQLQGKRFDQFANEAIVNVLSRDNKWLVKGTIKHKMPVRETGE